MDDKEKIHRENIRCKRCNKNKLIDTKEGWFCPVCDKDKIEVIDRTQEQWDKINETKRKLLEKEIKGRMKADSNYKPYGDGNGCDKCRRIPCRCYPGM